MPAKKAVKQKSNLSSGENKTITETFGSLKDKYFTKKYIIIALLIILIAGILFVSKNQIIVATINGEPINRFTLINELEKQDGKRVMESIVSKTLVLQEAKKKNIVVTQNEIDSEIKKIEEGLKARGQTLNQVLQLQGVTIDVVQEQIKLNLIMKKILGDKITVSDKEVADYIEKNKPEAPEGTKPEDLRVQIKTQLEQQKFQEKAQEFMKNLQDKAKINYYIKL